MKEDFCYWCWTKTQAPKNFNPTDERLFCSLWCIGANWLFEQHFSNKAILDREYLEEIKERGGE